MSVLTIKPKAKDDLQDIWWFIAQDSPNNADKHLDRIYDSMLILADNPQLGIQRESIARGLRSHVIGNYVVFYSPIENGVDIIRVLHGARDIEKLLATDQ